MDNEAREKRGRVAMGLSELNWRAVWRQHVDGGKKRFLVEDLSSQSKNFREFRLFAFLASDLLTVVRLGIIAKATPCLRVQRYHFLSCSAVNATVGFMALAPPNSSSAVVDSGTYRDVLYPELWKACAGPLVTLPCEGERVYYFPQGHMEQAEADTDEVFAQIMLLPESLPHQLSPPRCSLCLCDPINSMPSSVISSHSMHVGVLATASHAISTGTLFSVFNKPRFDSFSLICLWPHSEKEIHTHSASKPCSIEPSSANGLNERKRESRSGCRLFGVQLVESFVEEISVPTDISSVREEYNQSTQESQNQQLRSCTKLGFGRAVSLTILNGYNDLFLKLEEMFNIKGELFGKVKKWEVVYPDEEEDTLMVSDDPCHELSSMEIKPTSKISFPNADTKHTKLEDQISTLNKITDHLLATKLVHELFFIVRLAAGSAYRVQKVVLFVLWPLTDSPAVLLT
ncbi:hypothetical protein ZIOFF_036969 [Zingiber officinale]|uniref:Uncharacterized protein n=1 Tax=Zingiber officinale TaxID=94328 RepID=A0A8J5GIY0_ZINOF|nr:hypothetical protein ZIOFF_036969 [Zingiber officinale]